MHSCQTVGRARGMRSNSSPAAEVVARELERKRQKPDTVHLYSIARTPAMKSLKKVDAAELQGIASKVQALGIQAQVFQ